MQEGAMQQTSPRICYDLLHLCNCRFSLNALNAASLNQEDKSHRPESTNESTKTCYGRSIDQGSVAAF